MLKIDGISYSIPVKRLIRSADFLDKYATRTENGDLRRELLGVYFNYRLELGSTFDEAEYASLWAKLTEPKEFHTVTVPGETGDYEFTAYFADVSDELRSTRNGHSYWKGLTVSFIARSPVKSPGGAL